MYRMDWGWHVPDMKATVRTATPVRTRSPQPDLQRSKDASPPSHSGHCKKTRFGSGGDLLEGAGKGCLFIAP